MYEFKITDTPKALDTYSGDVEETAVTWGEGGLVLRFDTVSPEGYVVPVRLTLDAALADTYIRELNAARATTAPKGPDMRTADGVPIVHDLRVINSDMRWGHVDLAESGPYKPWQECGEWWFYMVTDDSRTHHLVSESRVATRPPR